MSSKSSSTSGGVGFFGLLGLVFIVLKLTEQIHWSWVWVLAPLWGGIAIALGLFCLYVVIVFLLALLLRKR